MTSMEIAQHGLLAVFLVADNVNAVNNRARPFRTPIVWVIGPVAAFGCVFLFWNLPLESKLVLPIWGGIGLVFYYAYGYRKSHVGRGLVEVHEEDSDAPGSSLVTYRKLEE